MDEIVIMLGGRAAEEEIFDEAYSGAADDLARVQKICVQMVTEFGMTVSHGPPDSAPLAQPTGDYAMSDRTRREVDENAQELAHMAYARARQLMKVNRRCLEDLASNALERETLTREDLDEIFNAHDLRRTFLPEDGAVRGAEADLQGPAKLHRRTDAAAHQSGRAGRELGVIRYAPSVLARLSWPTLPAVSLDHALRDLALLTGALVLKPGERLTMLRPRKPSHLGLSPRMVIVPGARSTPRDDE